MEKFVTLPREPSDRVDGAAKRPIDRGVQKPGLLAEHNVLRDGVGMIAAKAEPRERLKVQPTARVVEALDEEDPGPLAHRCGLGTEIGDLQGQFRPDVGRQKHLGVGPF